MSESSTTRAGARGAAAKGQVPRQRGQRPRQPAGRARANTERPREPARSGGISMPSMPAVPIARFRIPGNVLWWGGLAAVAALGIVDWPVAALVGAGTWIAQKQSRQSDRASSARERARQEPPDRQ